MLCHTAVFNERVMTDQPEALSQLKLHDVLWCAVLPLSQVIDLISLKPFDMETISKSIKKTRKALIVEECMKTGGIGASLSAVINESLFDELDHQVIGLLILFLF